MAEGNIGSRDADVIIKIATQLIKSKDNLDKQLSEMANKIRIKGQQEIMPALKKAVNLNQAFKDRKFEIKEILPKEQFKAVMKEYTRLGRTVGGKALVPLKRLNLANRQVAKSVTEARTAVKAFSSNMISAGLGTMFFGMAIKRAFTSIWKSGKTTFQDIMHSVEGTTTSFDDMDASIKYLGFTVGQALEPLAEMLAPIIWMLADWIANNPALSKFVMIIVAAGIAIGGFLMFVGQAAIGIFALYKAWQMLAGLKLGTKIAEWVKGLGLFKGKVSAVNGGFLKMIVSTLAWIAAIALLIAFIYTIALAWENVKKAFVLRWEEIKLRFKYGVLFLQRAWNNFKYMFELGVAYMGLAWAKFVDALMEKFVNLVNANRGWINGIIRVMKWLGVNISTIPKLDFEPVGTQAALSNIASIETEWYNAIHSLEQEMWEVEKSLNDIWNQQGENAADAWEKIKAGWTDLFVRMGFGAEGSTALADAAVSNNVAPTQDSFTQIDQIIINTQQNQGESQADYVQRIIDEFKSQTQG